MSTVGGSEDEAEDEAKDETKDDNMIARSADKQQR